MESRLSCLFLLVCLGSALAAPELLNEEVKRTVDLSTHLAKVTAELSLVNPAGGSGNAASFLLALDPGLESHLAYLGVQVSDACNSGGCDPPRVPAAKAPCSARPPVAASDSPSVLPFSLGGAMLQGRQ